MKKLIVLIAIILMSTLIWADPKPPRNPWPPTDTIKIPMTLTEDLTIGNGAAGVDYTITIDGETSDGLLTYDEDNAMWIFSATPEGTTAVNATIVGEMGTMTDAYINDVHHSAVAGFSNNSESNSLVAGQFIAERTDSGTATSSFNSGVMGEYSHKTGTLNATLGVPPAGVRGLYAQDGGSLSGGVIIGAAVTGKAQIKSAGTLATGAALYAEPCLETTGSITTCIGIYIAESTVGTNNYGIWLNGAGDGTAGDSGAAIAFGSTKQALIFYNAVNGFVLTGGAGSTNDFTLQTAGGTADLIKNPTGTTDLVIGNDTAFSSQADVFLEGRLTNARANGPVNGVTCADSADGNPGELTITPLNSYIELTNNDAHGCLITLSETKAIAGQFIEIWNVSANSASIVDEQAITLTGNVHDGGDDSAFLSDASAAFETDCGGANKCIGLTVTNTTKGESCVVTADTETTLVCTLSGSADWDDGNTATLTADQQVAGAGTITIAQWQRAILRYSSGGSWMVTQ